MGQIEISSYNVRSTRPEKKLKDLEDSIKKFGLFQPITVFKQGKKYMVLVGQRRFLAFQNLDRKTIPAFIIKPLDSPTKTIVSFGENILRQKLPYEDAIKVCDKLYNEYHGSKKEKVGKLAKDLGISEYLVSKYLAHKLVPPEVRAYVSSGKMSEELAYRITATYFPNVKKIISIAKYVIKMTKTEAQRAMEYGRANPKASVDEILDYAKNPPPFIKLIIHIEPDTDIEIKQTARKRRQSVETFIKDAIFKSLDDED